MPRADERYRSSRLTDADAAWVLFFITLSVGGPDEAYAMLSREVCVLDPSLLIARGVALVNMGQFSQALPYLEAGAPLEGPLHPNVQPDAYWMHASCRLTAMLEHAEDLTIYLGKAKARAGARVSPARISSLLSQVLTSRALLIRYLRLASIGEREVGSAYDRLAQAELLQCIFEVWSERQGVATGAGIHRTRSRSERAEEAYALMNPFHPNRDRKQDQIALLVQSSCERANSNLTCENGACGKKGALMCQRCHPRYCSSACQAAHWNGADPSLPLHKTACKQLQKRFKELMEECKLPGENGAADAEAEEAGAGEATS